MKLYRGIVYNTDRAEYWKYTRIYTDRKKALHCAVRLARRDKITSPLIKITESFAAEGKG